MRSFARVSVLSVVELRPSSPHRGTPLSTLPEAALPLTLNLHPAMEAIPPLPDWPGPRRLLLAAEHPQVHV